MSALTQKVLRETTAFVLIEIFGGVLTWGTQIALARLLNQRDFGVFGICVFYVGLGELLGNGGLGATLLRRRTEPSNEEYQSTLTALLSVALTLGVLLFAFAPAIGRHNHLTSGEVNALRAMSPIYLLGALRVVPYVRLERQLAFSTIARIELIARTAKHVTALTIAFGFGGVWALIASQLVAAIVQLTVAYVASPGWVRLGFSWKTFRPLIAYGSKVQSLAVCAYFKDNLSRGMLGSWMGPAAVGVYDFGVAYIQVPVVAVNGLARVQLPVYARFDASDPALYQALRGSLRAAAIFGLPLLGALALGSPLVIPLVYGNKWVLAYPVIWGLLANMACSLLLSPLFTLLQGQGRAGLAVIVFSLWSASTWVLAVSGLLWVSEGLAVVAAAQSLAAIATTAYLLVWASRHLQRSLLTTVAAPFMAGMLALVAGIAIECMMGGGWINPVAAVSLFLVLYFLGIVSFEGRTVLQEIRAIVQSVRAKPPSEEGQTQC